MSVIAFNFSKILAERTSPVGANYRVSNETEIVNVAEVALGKQKALSFTFVNRIVYEPKVGRISLEGDVLVLSNDEEAKATLESFKKTKQFSPELTQKVYNTILSRTVIQALVVSRDLGLPAPVKLPQVNSTVASEGATTPTAKGKTEKPAAESKPKKK